MYKLSKTKKKFFQGLLLSLLVAGGGSFLYAQPAVNVLSFEGDGFSAKKWTASDLKKYKRHEFLVKDRKGKKTSYQGILLSELLRDAGFVFGKRGYRKYRLGYLVVKGRDGYKALFSFTELDSSFSVKPLLLAERVRKAPLAEHKKPFQLIVPFDTFRSRWVRGVSSLHFAYARDSK